MPLLVATALAWILNVTVRNRFVIGHRVNFDCCLAKAQKTYCVRKHLFWLFVVEEKLEEVSNNERLKSDTSSIKWKPYVHEPKVENEIR